MTDRFLTTPTEVSVTCTRLPGRETNLARCEMAHASGGFVPPRYCQMLWMAASAS